MDVADHIAHLEMDGHLLADAAARGGWDASVPGLDWNVRDLVTHVGGVHRWAADIVHGQRAGLETAAGDAVGTGPAEDVLLAWYRTGHTDLVTTLRSAPPDVQCATVLPTPDPLAFWARRQAHETAIHRADAEAALGQVTPFGAGFAQDGIDEILCGFAARGTRREMLPATVCLRASDGPSWTITLDGRRIAASPTEQVGGDLLVSGTSSDLYLWLWNRPSDAAVEGWAVVAETWANSLRIRWS